MRRHLYKQGLVRLVAQPLVDPPNRAQITAGPQLSRLEQRHPFGLYLRLLTAEKHLGGLGLAVNEAVERFVVELEREPRH